MPAERLQKIIAAAGIASRRKAEQLITGGLVSVNGKVVTELGSKADAEIDHIRVNGKLLHGAERHVYVVMNKPKGYVTTLSDPERRPTVMDLLRGVGARVYPRPTWAGKMTTFFQVLTVLVGLVGYYWGVRRVASPLLWLAAAFTLISGLQYLVQGMRFLNAAQDAEREESHELYLR